MSAIEQTDILTGKKEIKSRNLDNIISYLATDDGVDLYPVEQEILNRITFVDELIRQHAYKRAEIASMVMQRFSVSLDCAYRDIRDAEYIFSSSTPMNKRYRVGLRIELLEEWIKKAADDKDWPAVARMETVLAKYWELYPELKPREKPQTIIYNVTLNSISKDDVIDLGDAILIAEKEMIENGKNA